MAKSSKGKAIGGSLVGRSAPGRANSGVSSPAEGIKVGKSKSKGQRAFGKSYTKANGTRTGVMHLPSGSTS